MSVSSGMSPIKYESVILAEEGSILWRAVKEHIGSRDPLWNLISHWKRDLLGDCQATAGLNRGARNRAEEEFGIPVLWGSGHPEPHLAAPLVRWSITAACRVTRGEKACDVVEEVRDVGGGRLEAVNGLLIAMGMESYKDWKVKLRKVVKEMAVSSELEDAMMARQKLQQVTGNLHRALEEYLLIHHLPGRCSLCRKLGG